MFWPFRRRLRPRPGEPGPDAAAIVRRARRLRFRVRPESVAALTGVYIGARPGTGLTFSELKPYEPGDDVRHLDWNVTARQGRPYVRRFVEERLLTLWLVVDVSASLRFGPDGKTKADRAAQAAALLAAAAIQGGDRCGLILVSDRVEAELVPGGGPRHLARLLRLLVATPANSRATDLSSATAPLRRANRRGLVIVLSDFLAPGPTGPWRWIGRRHDLIGLRLVEPSEENLANAGLIDLEDAETGERLLIDSASPRVRAASDRNAAERLAAFRSWCGTVNAAGHEIATSEDPIAPLLRIFRGKAPGRAGTRHR